MIRSITKCLVVALLAATCVLADFSYEQTTTITGGMMAGMMKFAGAFSKQAREPIKNSVAVKGDRMMHGNATRASIIDVGKETITEIDFQKKQYSVMTFAEMKQMMDELAQKMKDKKSGDMQIKVEAKETGQSKQIGGFDTKEVIMKIIMESQNPETGQKGTMTMTVDSWQAPKMAGYEEVTAFYKRMGEKLDWAPGGGMMTMGRPDVAKAMAEMYKGGSKLNGIPVYQVIQMGMEGLPNQGGAAPAEAQQQPQQQQPQQRDVQVEKPTVGGALGSALGGRLGRLGGLGRKKKQEDPPPQQQPAQQPAEAQTAAQTAPAQQRPADASGALMEATSEYGGFSAAAVDPAKFQVPAGFKQVQPDRRMR